MKNNIEKNNFDEDLIKSKVNFVPLTPVSFLYRTAKIFPDRKAWVYENESATYSDFLYKVNALSEGLKNIGIKKNDVVSVLLPNVPAMLECHFGVPISGGVLNTINTRLDAKTISYILNHSKTKIFIFYEELFDIVKEAIDLSNYKNKLICVKDKYSKNNSPLKKILNYENFVSSYKNRGKVFKNFAPDDEWDALSLNYTSGTTGKPKGVVYHHRGAYLMALNNQMVWQMDYHPIYLWTLPMFHCNGWCFPWTITAVAGTHVCLNKVDKFQLKSKLEKENISHLCGAPIILNMIIEMLGSIKLKKRINIMTAAAPPPPTTLKKIEEIGFKVTHVYGLTETYGPAVICEWNSNWDKLSPEKRSLLKSRQGVNYPSLEYLDVKDPKTMKSVKKDSVSLGEVMMQGNIVMKGYLKSATSNKEAFKDNWFHTGDLAVMHQDGYIELKDRSKDIIISGGENISSIEIESIIHKHEGVLDCAVVAKNDNKWGEVPCAFIELKKTKENKVKEVDILKFCRKHIASYKIPKKIYFQVLPRTSTGKIKKFILRELVRKI